MSQLEKQYYVSSPPIDDDLECLVGPAKKQGWIENINYFLYEKGYYYSLDDKKIPFYVVADKNNKRLGGVCLCVYDSKTCWISLYIIEETQRGKGAGGYMLDYAMNSVKEKYPGISFCLHGSDLADYYEKKFGIIKRFNTFFLRFPIKDQNLIYKKNENIIHVDDNFLNQHRDEIIKYDNETLKNPRINAFDYFVKTKTLYIYREDNQIKGLMRRDNIKIYNLLADNEQIAYELLSDCFTQCDSDYIDGYFNEQKLDFFNSRKIVFDNLSYFYFQTQSENNIPLLEKSYALSTGTSP